VEKMSFYAIDSVNNDDGVEDHDLQVNISLDTSNDPALPFNFVRHQFPVRLAYAMTINKSQGQTFDKVGLYLSEPCFSHSHFYTGCSRAMGNYCLKIQVKDTTRQGKINNGQTVTDNVVYQEIFSSTPFF
jgi:ATP-dependent DNA helicase PIF1